MRLLDAGLLPGEEPGRPLLRHPDVVDAREEVRDGRARLGRGLEVEAYKVYLDLWWEVQFLLDPSLLSVGSGC